MIPWVFWKSVEEWMCESAAQPNDRTKGALTMSPQWSDLVLSTDIPYSEGDVFVLYSLDIETWMGERYTVNRLF
jgi:hypothetical protein